MLHQTLKRLQRLLHSKQISAPSAVAVLIAKIAAKVKSVIVACKKERHFAVLASSLLMVALTAKVVVLLRDQKNAVPKATKLAAVA
jgi:hypothetical protein